MIWLIFVCAIIVIVLVWLVRRPNYYSNVTRDEFKHFFQALIKQGSNQCLLLIKHMNSKRFVQFAKYIADNSEIIINFGFPDAPWSREYFRPLIRELNSAGIDYAIESTSDKTEFVTRFIDVNMKLDKIDRVVTKCIHITNISFKVMGIGDEESFRIHFEGKLYPDTESTRPALKQLRHHKKKWVRRFANEYLEVLNNEKREGRTGRVPPKNSIRDD